ncbi:Serine/threonine-protein kinase, partial [Borealophlyctis nickersoniae]
AAPPGSTPSDLKSWRPEGTLIAHLSEHRGPINALKLSADHAFFATASDDGTVKVWDTQRLERNVTNRSRLTYVGHGGKVKSLAFCENTHSIASISDNGSIHVSRVEYMSTGNSSRYMGYHPVRRLELEDDYATVVEHYETETESMLVYATAKGTITGLDLRTMKPAWTFTNPPHHGSITALALDRRRTWVTTGSHRGVMSLWDVRFGLRLKAWGHPSRGRIHKLAPFVGKGGNKFVSAAVEGRTNEVSVWDVEEGECTDVWCVVAGTSGGGGGGGRGGADVEEEMNRLYGSGLKGVPPPELGDFGASAGTIGMAEGSDQSVRGFATSAEGGFMVTGGTDRKIRFWDMGAVEGSYVVCGLEGEEAAPRYSAHSFQNINFNLEYTPSHHFSSAPTSGSGTPVGLSSPRGSRSRNTTASSSTSPQLQGGGKSSSNTGTSGGGGTAMVASPTVTRHLDAITDVVVTQVPYPMVVSCGRDGVVKVWK